MGKRVEVNRQRMNIAIIDGEYRVDLQTGIIKNAGYRIYRVSWQKHKNRKPVVNRRPRWKFVSVWPTEAECRAEVERLQRIEKP